MAKVIACRWCTARIVVDDEERSVSHEHPECDGFRKLLATAARLGIRPTETRITYRDGHGNERTPGKA